MVHQALGPEGRGYEFTIQPTAGSTWWKKVGDRRNSLAINNEPFRAPRGREEEQDTGLERRTREPPRTSGPGGTERSAALWLLRSTVLRAVGDF